MYGAACSECVKGMLLKHLSNLKRTLEDKYGPKLNQWLASGRFINAGWEIEDNFQVSYDRLKSFIREIIRDAVAKGEIRLNLPSGPD